MTMTDREKLVELLMEKGFGVEGANIAADHLIANGVTFAKDDVPTKWISVKDRLPEDGERVLIVDRWKDIQTVVFHKGQNLFREDYVVWYVNTAVDDVTHWMPLPSLPKGE